jgi:hypothetical protein
MAEVKNAFIKSKMNKDLDARLIPQGEYRDAVNIQVSKSEGDDVGALENVLGNKSVADFNIANGGINVGECIGTFVDEFNSIVYLFFTDYTDPYTDNISTYSTTAKNFIFSFNTRNNIIVKLVEGSFLNFSTNRPIIGVNLLENLLFFTDNRNQPRKINIQLAVDEGITYYNTEDKISVAKYNPYQAIEVIKETSPGSGIYETTMKDRFSEFIPLNQGSGGVPTAPNVTNPYWAGEDSGGNPNFAGDPQYLEDKFVRFSYRFRFVDGEYSIFAPFTQECFIPKQDGYFLFSDEKQSFATTVVEFMENKVNQIDLQIPLPTGKSTLNSDFQITEIDILYKESDSLATQVVETIQVVGNPLFTGTDTTFEYSYLSTKPYRTLPESELIRVYDKIPVKAFGQEIISNRIVYSNFQDKHTPPPAVDYQVSVTPKYGNAETYTSLSQVEYPNHSVKQNRNYQVGVVLADRYGRQSTTLLSNNTDDSSETFRADTVYLPYKNSNNSITFPGDSLKVQFNTLLTGNGFDKNELNGIPGLYNGNPTSDGYNPLGWYSYKIVVKQLEQEYYNVYTSGAVKGQPENNTAQLESSFVVLLNDNINKVPRDLSEVGPQDKTFRSSVRLFGRVENIQQEFSNIGNAQYLPGRRSFTTNAIEDLFDIFDTSDAISNHPITNTSNPYYTFLRGESNPFIGEFITSQTPDNQFGVINDPTGPGNTYVKTENLAVLETAPTVSRLDIFWESTTTGLISVLNEAIDDGGSAGIGNFISTLTEATSPGDVVVDNFFFTDLVGNPLTPNPTTVTLVRQYNNATGTDVTKFNLVDNGDGTYDITVQAGEYFYYGTNGTTYALEFNVDGGSPNFTRTISIGNVAPSITNTPTTIAATKGQVNILTPITGVNGSNPAGGQSTIGLTYSITSQSGSGNFIISGSNVTNNDSTAEGSGTFTLQVTDAGGAIGSTTFTVNFTPPTVPSNFSNGSMDKQMFVGEGYSAYFASNATGISTGATTVVNSGTTNNYMQGFSSLSALNSTVANDLCTAGSNYTGQYTNKSSSGGLTQGSFYVLYYAQNLYNVPTYQNHRYGFQYRQNENSSWQACNDIAGQSIQYNGATSKYDGYTTGTFPNEVITNTDAGMLDTTNSLTPPASYGPGSSGIGSSMSKEGSFQAFYPYSGIVYAFDITGDYRFLFGNMASSGNGTTSGTGLAQDVPFDLNANLDCNSYGSVTASGWSNNPPVTDGTPNALEAGVWWQVSFGDFNDPDWVIAPDGKNDGGPNLPASNLFPGIYRYEISITNRSTAYTGIEVQSIEEAGVPPVVFNPPYPVNSNMQTVYAAEPFAKYVTQFYTDNTLTTKFTANNGNFYFFKRMRFTRIDNSDPNFPTSRIQFYEVSNPENTVSGFYQTRLDSSGLNIGVNNLGPGGSNINGTAALPVLNPQKT